ncbi:formylglycine-generating enzyme family protein [Parasphingopyxis algicola]|uniref:formylglycine-generating enzyme family protein n=1 Tax=Parasphingopyxis algicola TaxID=2026624 RepID=UPI0015A4EDD6|nr:formylglycine-generating enzyme family protein [Parasphingopyxis algicola]QLC24937.1 formylglycine-generating enzyme family protein [Parasphingopyxis algicola]
MRRRLTFCFMAALSACEQPADFQTQSGSAAPEACARDVAKMVWIPGGRFIMGEAPLYREEGPPRAVDVDGFWMRAHEVTQGEFAEFVEATGYVTVAERAPPRLPGAPQEMSEPGSAVFAIPDRDDPRWWRWAIGANWRQPTGANDRTQSVSALPVVQIAYEDAEAYARWARGALPTEAQWEYAARDGGGAQPEPIGADGRPQANYYQGIFPVRDLGEDGYSGRAPVGCFAPNDRGLHDMIGNVWEWTSSPGGFSAHTRVIKGGSYLCAANYCARYRPAARQFQESGLGTNHIGFRIVDNDRPPPDGA